MVNLIYLLVAILMFVAWGLYIDEKAEKTVPKKSVNRFYAVMQVVFAVTNIIYLLLAIKNPNLLLTENILKEGGEVILYVLYVLPLLLYVGGKLAKRIKKTFIDAAIMLLWVVYSEICLILYITIFVYMVGIC